MTKTALLRIAVAALVTAVPACAVARQAPAPMDTATCGAVAAAIDSLVIGSRDQRAGFRDVTQPRRDVDETALRAELARMPGIDSATLRSFRENNARPMPSCAALPLVGGTTRLTQEDLAVLPTSDPLRYWNAFKARYPGVAGVTQVSGVGMGRGGRQALLMLDHRCGGRCGAGHIVLLERDDEGKWRVTRAVMTWIS